MNILPGKTPHHVSPKHRNFWCLHRSWWKLHRTFFLRFTINFKTHLHASSSSYTWPVLWFLPHFLEGRLCRLRTHHRWLSDRGLLLEPRPHVHRPVSSAALSSDQSLPQKRDHFKALNEGKVCAGNSGWGFALSGFLFSILSTFYQYFM